MTKQKSRKRNRKEVKKIRLELNPETKKGILVIFLFALSLVSIFGFFGLAGLASNFINNILGMFFGWGRYLFPLVLLIIGYLLLNPEKYIIRGENIFGLIVLGLSLTGLMHLSFKLEGAIEAITMGQGGGYAGLILSYPLQKIIGFWGSLIVLISLLIISILITFNTNFSQLKEKGNFWKDLWNNFKLSLLSYKYKGKTEEGEVEPSFTNYEMDLNEETVVNEKKMEEINQEEVKEEKKDSFLLIRSKIKIELPLDLLNNAVGKPTSGDIKTNLYTIQKTLENFNIPVEMGEVKVGPTVTQFTLKPSEGIKLSRITTLHNDLALALAAHPIRIEAPIPGKSLVGIEVPNQKVALVPLRSVLTSEEFKKRKTNLMVVLGKDVAGHDWLADLGMMPHLLVAGATGSGKSMCLNSIITGLLYQNSPDDLKFILVDPKRVEFPIYNGMPHLLTPVITDIKKTVNALKWTILEMDRRFELLSKYNKREIHSYNQGREEKLPFIVFVIDELADLMSIASAEVEAAIIRLAQMARAVGIHLVVATQRPSVDIITGLIKANITSRIAFSVASQMDSRTILDTSGAEKLLGRGDMLYISSDLSKPKRLQGAYLSDEEIKRVTEFLKTKGQADYIEEIIEKPQINSSSFDFSDSDDDLLEEAKEIILKAGKASASLLQRRLKVGYARAARLLDLLEEQGLISPVDGAKPREILVNIYEEKIEDENIPL